MKKFLLLLIALLIFSNNAIADQIKMAYIEINEKSQNNFSVLFKVPMKAGRKLNLSTNLDKYCAKTSTIEAHVINKASLNIWNMKCDSGLVGKTLKIDGLKTSNTDLLLQLKFLNTSEQTALISKDSPSYNIPKELSSFDVVKTYTGLGVIHILEGFDHLLFVLSLLLIVKNFRTLIWTITAFTLAHSITLAGVTFGYLKLPQQPVEAVIALSIMFLAMEVLHKQRGINGIASRFPWIVSFTFGLLHGFGFAGALAEIGLPEQSVPLALLFFNVGVESGQLMFVSAVISIGFLLKKAAKPSVLHKARTVMVYGIGSMASFWFIERVAAF